MNAPASGGQPHEVSADSLRSLFDRRPDEGVYRVHRSVYTDPALFELEMARIFEGSWIFLGHDSLIPHPFDFFTCWMGRKPVVVNRDGAGKVRGFINACSHRGARLCRTERGNKPQFACTYHGWTYDAEGQAVWVQRQDDGYPDSFSRESVNLRPVARLENYRGFIFGSLNPDVPSLADHLRGAATFIDMLVEQHPKGFRVLRGASSCIYHGNWKLMLENGGGDGLHPDYAHKSLLTIAGRKRHRHAAVKTMQIDKMHEKRGGQWAFGNGHSGIWFNFPNPQDRPIYRQRQRLQAEFGPTRAEWMTGIFRNLSIYPNLHLLDQMATLIRQFRPLDIDKTEITFYCLAPVEESAPERISRLRQFEEFFMGSGMGTPDDNAEFAECQLGAMGKDSGSSFTAFGLHNRHDGTDQTAQSLGIELESSGVIGYEGCTMTQYDRWLRLMASV